MEKTVSKKKENRIEKQLGTLEAKESFQKYIKDLRKSLGMPLKGFRSLEEKENWLYRLNTNNLICSVADKGKNHTSNRNNSEYMIQMEWFLEDNREYEFKDILEKFRLSDFYKDFIRGYVYYGDFFAYSTAQGQVENNTKIRWFAPPDLRNIGKVRIFIEIYADTTTKDIQSIWEEIVEAKKETIGHKEGHYKFQSSKNREIDKRMDELKKQGMQGAAIDKIIKKEFGVSLGYDYVPKRISRFRKRK